MEYTEAALVHLKNKGRQEPAVAYHRRFEATLLKKLKESPMGARP